MQAITTKVLPATNRRPTRVKAIAKGGSVTLTKDGCDGDCHDEAATALCLKLNWKGYLIRGVTHEENYVYVFLPHIGSEPRWDDMLTVGNPVKGPTQ